MLACVSELVAYVLLTRRLWLLGVSQLVPRNGVAGVD